MHSGSHVVVNFKVSPITCRGKVMAVEGVVLSKVTTNVPLTSVSFNNNWKHFSNLQLADFDFSTPRNINLILGANVFSLAICYAWRFRPPGSPSVFKAAFGWVLASTIDERPCKRPIIKVCH